MSRTNDWNERIIKEFRENKGRVGGNFAQMPLLLVHTTGAKSGAERINPVAYLEEEDRLVIVASKGGSDNHPDWYYNLKANPEVTVELGTETFKARANITQEPKRTELFAKMATRNPGFQEYEKKTARRIPVVILERLN
ncbi:MAG: nitroreductase family deazaflavin-dependent oxidoreductase [Chloroflexi bacterium]|nr:nitroreductase family deazaflavin-dependent oxidoreductase [Chloroflexota bacterium]MQC27139.1 nitroreductase family deazaflavin-dependent oxidoreductase [Chloroflexota bacterium]